MSGAGDQVRNIMILSLDPPTLGFRVRRCNETGLGDDGVARCQRPLRHGGAHAHLEGDEIVVWQGRQG